MMKILARILSVFLLALPASAESGKCRVFDKDIASSYVGPCKDGKAEGRGTARGRDQYTGDFVSGLKHGQGTYTWASGHKYTGQYRHDQKHGQGVETTPESAVQKCLKQEKRGTWFCYVQFSGEFKKSRFLGGKITVIMSDGKRITLKSKVRYEGDEIVIVDRSAIQTYVAGKAAGELLDAYAGSAKRARNEDLGGSGSSQSDTYQPTYQYVAKCKDARLFGESPKGLIDLGSCTGGEESCKNQLYKKIDREVGLGAFCRKAFGSSEFKWVGVFRK